MRESGSILWRRVDVPGHESARVFRHADHRHLEGAAVFAEDGKPCRLDYRITCDAAWRTVSASVSGWVGDDEVRIELDADASGRWRMNGVEQPQVEGCVDVDLNFSPSTNLLPIRRLGLAVGEQAPVAAAWLRFPSFALERFEQSYRRGGDRAWRYESADGEFARDLAVDDVGLVTEYPGLWVAEASG